MKKIAILLGMSLVLASSVNSQTLFKGTATNPGTLGETAVLNATVDTLDLEMSGSYSKVMTIHARLTKTSGTIAGTMRLYGSNWKTTGTWHPVSDTATLSNQSVNSKVWTITEPAYKYYRILQDGGTTMAGTLAAKALAIKPN